VISHDFKILNERWRTGDVHIAGFAFNIHEFEYKNQSVITKYFMALWQPTFLMAANLPRLTGSLNNIKP